jgi:hypothetical protein
MKKVSQEAGHRPAVAPRHRGARAPGGAKRADTKTVRVQLHLGEQVAKRLNVHAALVGRNASRVAEEILLSYLSRFGQGREIFDSPGGVDHDDRVPEAIEASDTGADAASRRGL